MKYEYNRTFWGHNLSPLFLRANVPVRRPIIREIRETMALRTIIDNVKMNISQDSTIEIGIGEYQILRTIIDNVKMNITHDSTIKIGIGDGAEDDNR